MTRITPPIALASTLLSLTICSPLARAAMAEEPEYSESPQWPNPTLPWPNQYSGTFRKIDSARLFDETTDESSPALLVLAGTDLVLVRAPMSKPEDFLVATGVSDFCVLPPQNGVSRVAISTPAGLSLSEVAERDNGVTIEFPTVAIGNGTWKSVAQIDAAASGAVIAIVGRKTGSNTLARAELSASGVVSGLIDLSPTNAVLGIAVAETDTTRAGAEIAFTSTSNKVYVLEWGGTQFYSYQHALGLLDVERIPRGCDDTRDSFALIAEWDYGGGVLGDVLVEIVDQHLSAPLFGGAVRVAHFDIGSAGVDTRSDFAASSSTSPDLFVLHGTAPAPNYPAPFEFRLDPEFWFVPLTSPTFQHPPIQPFVAVDDYDLDGDGDLALVGSSAAGRGIWFVRGAVRAYEPAQIESSDISSLDVLDPEVSIDATVTIPLPASWGTPATGEVDKVRIRVWVQDDVNELVNSTPAGSLRFVLQGGTAFIDDWIIPTPQGATNAILHFEFLPMRIASSGTIVKQGGLTFAAGAVDETDYVHYMCLYPDEFNPPEIDCEHDDAPIVTAINRRTVIRPTNLYPQ